MRLLNFFRRKPAAHVPVFMSADGNASSGNGRLLPSVRFETQFNHMKCFTSPSPDVKATVFNENGISVGRVSFAVSPLHDRLYIFDIAVFDEYRRNGIGMAIIDWLSRTYQVPLITVKEVFSASAFWTEVRRFISHNGGNLTTISVGEMPAEAARWSHLKGDSEALERQITERLLRGESYESAVGRGLDPLGK